MGRGEVRIVVDDREDETCIELPENFYGDITLLFQAGVLVHTKQTAVRMKKELRNGTDGTHGTNGGGGM